MNRLSRTALIAVSLSLSAVAFAQAPSKSGGAGSAVGRGDVFYYAPMQQGANLSNPLDNTGIGRPSPRNRAQVTPVPEPSQWAMMLAGLALVGFIVRRSSRRS